MRTNFNNRVIPKNSNLLIKHQSKLRFVGVAILTVAVAATFFALKVHGVHSSSGAGASSSAANNLIGSTFLIASGTTLAGSTLNLMTPKFGTVRKTSKVAHNTAKLASRSTNTLAAKKARKLAL